MSYHHGDLRRELLDAAARHVAADGAEALSLRSLAASAGVSHAAPAHHFGGKQGLFTALAAEGFHLLAEMLEAQSEFLEQAVAYVHFAIVHPGHFAVMFQPALLDPTDDDLAAARERSGRALTSGAAELASSDEAALRTAAFSLVHGYATLRLAGAVQPQDDDFVRRMARLLG